LGGQVLSQVADKVFFVFLIALLAEYPSACFSQFHAFSHHDRLYAASNFFWFSSWHLCGSDCQKQILVASNLVRALLTFAIPVLPKRFLILLLITFAISTVTQFLPQLSNQPSHFSTTREFAVSQCAVYHYDDGCFNCWLCGGEPLLSLARDLGRDYGQEILVGGLYLVAGGLIQLIPFKEQVLSVRDLVTVNPWSDFTAGLRYLKKNRLVWNAMLQLTVLYSVFAALTVLAIDLATAIGLKSTQFGFCWLPLGRDGIWCCHLRALGRSLPQQTSAFNWF
jgi:hypothetical protein